MDATKLTLGPMDNNVYIVVCPQTKESLVIDASFDADKIAEAMAGTTPRYIILTHGDGDHIDALDALKARLNVPVGIHQADAGRLSAPADFFIEDGQEISVGRVTLKTLHTPGHTPGSVCFYVEPAATLFSGDTLFPGGPGATHDNKDDFAQIVDGVRAKLFVLPNETAVRPGHGSDTTIGTEKPHLQEWIDRGY